MESEKTDNTCPLCGSPNHCAVAAGAAPESCWCHETSICAAALAALPGGERHARCICPGCARTQSEE